MVTMKDRWVRLLLVVIPVLVIALAILGVVRHFWNWEGIIGVSSIVIVVIGLLAYLHPRSPVESSRKSESTLENGRSRPNGVSTIGLQFSTAPQRLAPLDHLDHDIGRIDIALEGVHRVMESEKESYDLMKLETFDDEEPPPEPPSHAWEEVPEGTYQDCIDAIVTWDLDTLAGLSTGERDRLRRMRQRGRPLPAEIPLVLSALKRKRILLNLGQTGPQNPLQGDHLAKVRPQLSIFMEFPVKDGKEHMVVAVSNMGMDGKVLVVRFGSGTLKDDDLYNQGGGNLVAHDRRTFDFGPVLAWPEKVDVRVVCELSDVDGNRYSYRCVFLYHREKTSNGTLSGVTPNNTAMVPVPTSMDIGSISPPQVHFCPGPAAEVQAGSPKPP